MSILLSGKTIFISPLDWGLGHATRCVPIIHSLSKNNTVVIGVTHLNAVFFDKHFPELQKAELPSYKISYSKHGLLWLKLLSQWPVIRKVIKQEKKILEKIVSHFTIDVVISDNRFGLINKNTHCIFITHQLKLKTPFFSFLVNRINTKYIQQFNEVWVPDYKEEHRRLSGQLSDSFKVKIPVKYIGPKSALTNGESAELEQIQNRFDYLILLSGVEPQRGILENLLLRKFRNSEQKIVLVRGSDTNIKMENKNITVIDFAYGEKLRDLILMSDTVICRSGYSTLMDLHLLNKKKCVLIPTPGQPEQEYLARYWKEKFNSICMVQNKIKDYYFF